MLVILAFRHLLEKKARAVALLAGFAAGVGVMIVLLSVGEAMLVQSRDVRLVGGGEVTVLPQGIDLEALRTGALRGMFLGVDRARFLQRMTLGGPRESAAVRAVSPVIEDKLLYLRTPDGAVHPVRAGGEIPSRAREAGSGLDVIAGTWEDSPADTRWFAPTPQQLYDDLDRFHIPDRPDSSWAEWHYFNVRDGDEWWYITYLVGGTPGTDQFGGQLLVTARGADGRHRRYETRVSGADVVLDTTRADLVLGGATVHQRGGQYFLAGQARGPGGTLTIDLTVTPAPHRYFPPIELNEDGGFRSGYAVPALRAGATGRLCVGGRCRWLASAPAYHDHNWGVWRDVTWEWGAGQGTRYDLLYGGVREGEEAPGNASFFLALVDSAGLRQVFRFRAVSYEGRRETGARGMEGPERFTIVASRGRDTLRLEVEVRDLHATPGGLDGNLRRAFVQMRGRWRIEARLGGSPVSDSGSGFFETFALIPAPNPSSRGGGAAVAIP